MFDSKKPPKPSQSRWLGVYLPHLPLDILFRGGRVSAPLAVSDADGLPRLVSCNEQAEARGVCPGLSLSAAYALCPELRVRKRDPKAESEALEVLAVWTGQFTSMVCLKPPQTLLLEVGASERLFGGLKPLLSHIRAGLEALGYHGRFAVSFTPLSASLLAAAGIEKIIDEPGRLLNRLAEVPLAGCGLDAKTADRLEKLGLASLADCYRLPRDGLARRFGPDMLSFLDRLAGRSPDPQIPYVPPLRFRSELQLTDAVEMVEPLLFAVHRLLLELVGSLRSCDCGIEVFVVRLFHHRAPPTTVEVQMLSPGRGLQHFQSLLKEKLETMVLTEAVERIELQAPRFMPYVSRSPDLFGAGAGDEDWWSLVEKLHARLGRDALRYLSTVEEHRPEYQWSPRCLERSKVVAPAQTDTGAYRPLWLLAEPLLLRNWQGGPQFRGALELKSCSERIETGWWDGRDVSRDYFRAVNKNGETFWIFKDRRSPERWYLQGIFG